MAEPGAHAPRNDPGPSDTELWGRAVAGDPERFGELFDRHATAIYNFCFRRTADWTAAEDLMSTTFLHAWRRRAEVRFAGDSVLPWLYGIAANLTRRHARGLGRRRAALARLPDASIEPDLAEDVVRRLDDGRRMREVLATIRSLPGSEQELLALCVWQGLSYEEAAVALDVPVGTVRSRLSRARARLRRTLAEPVEPGGDAEGDPAGTGRRNRSEA